MDEYKYINSGYNVSEPKGIAFTWTKEQYSFLYFQSRVLINGFEHSPGSCILYRKGTAHNYETLDGFVNSFVGFSCPEEWFDKLNITCDKVFYPSNCSDINSIIFDMCREKTIRDKCFEGIMQAKILELLVALSRGSEQNNTPNDKETYNRLLMLRAEFLSDVVSPPDFDTLLKKHGFSRTVAYKLYSKAFRTTPREDLIWARLEKARDLMHLNQDMKLREISDLCGFVNASHLLRMFKSRYGYTPGEYLNALKNTNE